MGAGAARGQYTQIESFGLDLSGLPANISISDCAEVITVSAVFNGVSEGGMESALASLPAAVGSYAPLYSGSSTSGDTLLAFAADNPSWQYESDDGGSYSGNPLYGFSSGVQLGTVGASEIAVVPEPSSGWLVGIVAVGWGALVCLARRRKGEA